MVLRFHSPENRDLDSPITNLITPVSEYVTMDCCWTTPLTDGITAMSITTATSKLIGYARVSTRGQDEDRQLADLRAAGVRADDLYVDHGVSGGKTSRPAWDRAQAALEVRDTLVVTTLDRMGRSTMDLLTVAAGLQERGVNLRVLNLGGENVNTATPTGRLLFTMMAGLAEMELEIKRERMRDSVAKRRAQGKNLGGRPRIYTKGKLRMARAALSDPEETRTAGEVAADLGMSRSTLFRRLKELEAD